LVRIGVIGAGKIAQRHIAAYRQIGCHEIFIADVNRQIAHQCAAEWEIQDVEDPAALIRRTDLDAIDVCAPTPFHASYVIAALESGKHVFCEKPLCLTTEEAYRIQEAAQCADRIVMTGYLYRFYPAFQFVKNVLDQHIIGSPYMALIRVGGRGSAAPWKHREGQGGGAVNEMMVHMLDLAAWYFGPISSVEPLWNTTLLPERNINGHSVFATAVDFSVVRMRAGDVRILCESDLATPSYMQHIDIQGQNGSIFSSILHYLPTVVFCKEPRGIYDRGNNIYTFPQENVFERELEHFLAAIDGSPHELNSLEDSIHIVELVEEIRHLQEHHAPLEESIL